MKLRVLVITKYHWKTRLKKHEEIQKLMKMDIQFHTVHKDLGKPEIKNKRITEKWFEEHISQYAKQGDYDCAIFQFSEADGKRWKIQSGIRGSNFKDTDLFGESWICADEDSVVKFKGGVKRNKYTKTLPHEIGHELKNQGITDLDIHDFDYKTTINNIEEFYTMLAIQFEEKKVKWAKYLPEPYFSNITQKFLEINPLYKTGFHLGVDHGVQGKTDVPVYAPVACKMTRHYTQDPILGNCAVLLSFDGNWAFRFAHLRDEPKNGEYNAGDQIGVVGTTGLSTGLHLHVDCFKDGIIRIDKLVDRDSIEKYCVDAHELVTKNI